MILSLHMPQNFRYFEYNAFQKIDKYYLSDNTALREN